MNGTPHTQSGWLLERDDTPHGNFELLVVNSTDSDFNRGFEHYWVDNHHGGDFDPDRPWTLAERVDSDRLTPSLIGGSMIMSDYGNLETVVVDHAGTLAHFYLAGILGWQGPTILPRGTNGFPAFIQGKFGGTHKNFEVVVPSNSGGLLHFFRDNGSDGQWHEARQPDTGGAWEGVGLIHSSFGNLEIVGVRDRRLVFMWQNGAGGTWSAPVSIAPGEFVGRPALIQGPYGSVGNFELIAIPRAGTGVLNHFWRDNNRAGFPWHGPIEIRPDPATDGGIGPYADTTVIHSSYGALEVMARISGEATYSHFRARLARPWRQAGVDWALP